MLEAVRIALSEILLHKTCPVTFFNINLPEKDFGYGTGNEQEIQHMPTDRRDLFKRNMIDPYKGLPDKNFANGKYQITDEMCYIKFLSNYYADIMGLYPPNLGRTLKSMICV